MSEKKPNQKQQKIDGLDVDELIRRNADDVFLHQNGLWHLMEDNQPDSKSSHSDNKDSGDSDIPF